MEKTITKEYGEYSRSIVAAKKRIFDVLKEEKILIGDVELVFDDVKAAINASVPVNGENTHRYF